MNKRLLLLMTLGLAIGPHISAFAQAAAESALTNALSSSATVKAGSALNHALNQSSTQLGTRIQERTSSSARVGKQQQFQGAPRTAMKGGATTKSSPALGGISVQGGETGCNSVSPPSPPSPANPSSVNTDPAKPGPRKAPASVNCRGNKSASDSGTGDKYKSFVTLSFPK